MANVQIPEELYIQLCKYHILGIQDEDVKKAIYEGLNAKYQAIERRRLYAERLQERRDKRG